MLSGLGRCLRAWIADSKDPRSLAARFRRRRWAMFVRLCAPDPTVPLLDVGGVEGDTFAQLWAGRMIRANRDRNALRHASGPAVLADACHLPFRDGSVAVAFSNSVIEHVGEWPRQQQMAAEIRRVARRYFVQTPDRTFPLEPHYLLPWFQYLPEPLQRRVHRLLPIGWIPRGRFEKVWLLSYHDLTSLFPDATLIRERFLGLSKSLYAVGPGNGLPSDRD